MSITFSATADLAPQVNMANGNAAAVLELLGYGTEQAEVLGQPVYFGEGEAAAGDFLGRILIALALVDASSDDETGRPEVQDGNWWHGGRRPGYLAGRLAELHELGLWARQREAEVFWS